jgi:hypothetical protein
VLCWPPAEEFGFSNRVCAALDKIYVASSLDATICNFIPDERRTRLGDLSRSPLEEILRHRLERPRLQQVAGHTLLADCPIAPLFSPSAGTVEGS